MADLKISQLTGATTPLAGTEVLPIVQSGSTKQVSVANLTAGRTVGTGAINATGAITLNNSIPLNWKNGSGTTRNVMQLFGNDLYVDNEDGSQIYRTAGYERWRVADASLTFTSTNLVQGTAAKGVNFTANTPAAGMTSQLLNWYEEGTWTPTQGAGLTVVGAFTSTGTYTRMGNLVFVSGILNGATSVAYGGGTTIMTGGLPFTINAGFAGGGNAIDSALAAGCGLIGNRGTTNIYGDAAIAATTRIFFTLTYIV